MIIINAITVFNMDISRETVLTPRKKKMEVGGITEDGTQMMDGATSTSTSGTIKVRKRIHST